MPSTGRKRCWPRSQSYAMSATRSLSAPRLPAPPPDPLAPTPLTVTNGTAMDYVVYVDHDGEMSRVTTVTAASQARYLIPSWMTQHSHMVRLFAHSIGSTGSLHPSDGSVNTEVIHILQGQ